MKSGGFHVKSGGFHVKPYKFKCFSKKSSVWWMQGGGYDPGFHEILGHGPPLHSIKLKTFVETFDFIRFLVDFMKSTGFDMKSTRFHVKSAEFHEIHRISWMWAFGWSPSIGLSIRKTNQNYSCLRLPLQQDWETATHFGLGKLASLTGNFRHKWGNIKVSSFLSKISSLRGLLA